MKKFIITTIMVFCLVFSCSFTTVHAASGYVTVKASTLKEYKKAAKENKKLKTQLDKKTKQVKTYRENLEKEKSKSQWVWMQIYSLGLSYNDKKWSVPKTIPNKFMVNGVTYYAEWE